jgi:hypothetical protein
VNLIEIVEVNEVYGRFEKFQQNLRCGNPALRKKAKKEEND